MLKLLSLFSGIGAFEKALENIDEPFEVIRYCEIDKYASKAYSLIHNLDENMNLKDVTTVNTAELPDDIDIITYGFPCQDISNAGQQKGFTNDDGSLTRSGLFFEALRIIEDTQPKIAIAENVKALVSKKFTAEFKIVLDCLNDAGYKNYWAVLNAKDFGVPQNRERVFIISIREDIDHGFKFPEKYELKLRLKDLLEENVDEKYFLSEKMLNFFLQNEKKQKEKGNGFRFNVSDGNVIAKAVTTLAGNRMDDNFIEEPNKDIKPELVGGIGEKKSNGGTQFYQQDRVYSSESIAMAHPAQIPGGNYKYTVEDTHQMTIDEFLPIKEAEIITVGNYSPSSHNASRVVDSEGIAPTVMENHGTVTAIVDSLPIKEATKKGYKEAHEGDYVNLQYPNSETRRDRVGEQCANTLQCNDSNGVVDMCQYYISDKGVKYILDPKRGMCTDINADVAQTLTAKGQNNWTGSFISPDINSIEKSKTIGSKQATIIHLKNGETITSDSVIQGLRIRKLTPKECFRLMGFDDKDCDILVENKISNTQIYKMAGNSIVVDVLEEIFVELLNQYEDVFPL